MILKILFLLLDFGVDSQIILKSEPPFDCEICNDFVVGAETQPASSRVDLSYSP
jgi:hypothetical protein